MTTKIRIDLSQGIVEAEGSETFVQRIYNDFKESLASGVDPMPPAGKKPKAPAVPKSKKRSLQSKKHETNHPSLPKW